MSGDIEKFPAHAPDVLVHHNQLAKEVAETLGCKDPLTRKFIVACFVAIRVFDYKQRSYGPRNIQRGRARGIVTRLGDKVSRLEVLVDRPEIDEKEPVEDSFGDSGVYGIMGLMVRWGWWPEVPAAYTSAPPAAVETELPGAFEREGA